MARGPVKVVMDGKIPYGDTTLVLLKLHRHPPLVGRIYGGKLTATFPSKNDMMVVASGRISPVIQLWKRKAFWAVE